MFTLVRGPIADKLCPTQARLVHDIREQLGPPNAFAISADWSFEVVLTFHHGRFHARIDEQHTGRSMTSLPSETEIPGGARDCKALAKWIAITVARLIDPNASPPPPPLPTPMPAPAAPNQREKEKLLLPPVESLVTEPRTSAARSTEPLKLQVAARGGLGIGLVPGIASEMSLFTSLGRGRGEATFGLSWTPETTITVPIGANDVTYAFGMNVAWFGGCFHALKMPRVVISTCAGGAIGSIHSAVASIDAAMPADVGERSWFGVSAAPRLRVFPQHHVFVETGMNVILTLHQRTYTACPAPSCPGEALAQTVFAQHWLALSGFLGVGVSIP